VNKTFAIIRREFIARVRTRTFVIATVLLPVFMIFVTVMPAMLMRGADRTTRVAIVDGTTNGLGASVEAQLNTEPLSATPGAPKRYDVQRVSATGRREAVRDSLVALTGLSHDKNPASLDGVLVLGDSMLQTGKAEYLGSNTSGLESMSALENSLSKVLREARLAHSGIDPAVLSQALRGADLKTTKVSGGKATGQSGATSFVIGYFMAFVLYLGVVLYGQQTMMSVIEEKTSRIMEVLASSVRPFQMLLGKVLGVGLTGLLQMAIWGGTLFLVTTQRVRIAGIFHVSPNAMQQFPIPTMSAGLFIVVLAYFILGFLLYGALYAAIGSMCNSTQDAQQYVAVLTPMLMVSFFAVFAIFKDPTGGIGVPLSIIPFFSQIAMPVRWSLSDVPPYQLAVSLGLGVLALLGATWIAGRIYRIGILMYGKKPSFKEIFHWIRAK
jgi:ABC-2 type transport system permease protein